MKDTEYQEPKKFPTHLLEYQTRSRQLPKELLELQDYLKQLSAYVEKYNRIKDNLTRQHLEVSSVSEREKKWSRKKKVPYREIGFSVKEEIGGYSPVQIIEMTPPEEVTVISGNEEKDKSEYGDEKEISSVIPNGKTGPDLASDGSEIGIYLIEHVEPVNFINILQRELSTLGKIFPDVNDIVKQITDEFDHYKVCRKCLDKVSPLLPDILKELQELIKFVRKKRNENYVWPDDSDYLRKTPEPSPRPFEKLCKELPKKKIREEAVNFLTVHTNTPKIIRDFEARAKGEPRGSERSERIRKCPMGASSRQQLTVLQSNIQSDSRRIRNAKNSEAEIPGPENKILFGGNSRLTEFSTSQVLKMLHPGPVVQTVQQYRVRGNIDYLVKDADSYEDESKRFLAPTNPKPDGGGFRKSQDVEARKFLSSANTELGKSHMEILKGSKMGDEVKTGFEDLKILISDVHKNQIELRKFLVANPGIIKLTDPLVLSEEKEKENIRKAKIILGEGNLDNRKLEDLQRLADILKSKCEMKNRLIMSLLKGLRSNAPCEQWEELVKGVIREPDSVAQSHTDKVLRHREKGSCSQRESDIEEILSEREIAGTTYEQATVPKRGAIETSSSEVLPKKSEFLRAADQMTVRESLLRAKSAMKDLDLETEKLFKDLENEVNSFTFEHNKILREIEGLKRKKSVADQTEDNKTSGSGCGSRTINLTIKIGEQDSMCGYHSALSIVPSGATLEEKKSELSFPKNISEVSKAPTVTNSIQEFKSALNLSKEELSKRHYSTRKSFTSLALKLKLPLFKDEETDCACKRTFHHVTGEKPGNCNRDSQDLGTTCPAARNSEDATSGSGNVSGSCLNRNLPCNLMSSEEIADSLINNDYFDHGLTQLQPQMNIHREQETIKKLKSHLRFLEDDLGYMKMTIDRIDILTEKLVEDACDSSENLKYVYNIFRSNTSRPNI